MCFQYVSLIGFIYFNIQMDARVHRVLRTSQEEAALYIQLDYLLPELLKRKLVTESEYQQLSDDKRIPDEKNKALLHLIETKGGEKSFNLFIQALKAEKQHIGHEHLARVLKSHLIKQDIISSSKPYKKVHIKFCS